MLPPAEKCERPKSIEGTINLTVRILENARKEPLRLRCDWYMSRACQELLEVAGISKELYRDILGLSDDILLEKGTGKCRVRKR